MASKPPSTATADPAGQGFRGHCAAFIAAAMPWGNLRFRQPSRWRCVDTFLQHKELAKMNQQNQNSNQNPKPGQQQQGGGQKPGQQQQDQKPGQPGQQGQQDREQR